MIRLSKSSIGLREQEAVARVLSNGMLGMGDEVRMFEIELQQFLGQPVACVVNGTAALQLALQAQGIGHGDEVLVPSLTYVASFQAIAATGARPVACDVSKSDLHLDIEDAESRITDRTKAIMPVHYSGSLCNMEEVTRLARHHSLRIVEDAAHAFGSSVHNHEIGSNGTVACFSFDGIKNITSGEGGCVVSDNAQMLDDIRDLRLLGVKGDSTKRFQGLRSWRFDVESLGWRYHMSNIMAAIGRVQLTRIEEFASTRKALAHQYMERLNQSPYVRPISEISDETVPHIFPVLLSDFIDRDKVRGLMFESGIETGIHYFPNHWLTRFRSRGDRPLPVTDEVFPHLLSIPLHADLELGQIEIIVTELERCCELATL